MFPLPWFWFPCWGFWLGLEFDLGHSRLFNKRTALRIKLQISPKQEKGKRSPWTAFEEDIYEVVIYNKNTCRQNEQWCEHCKDSYSIYCSETGNDMDINYCKKCDNVDCSERIFEKV